MLNTLFSILLTPIKPIKSDSRVSSEAPAKKHLAFQTIYSTNPNLLNKPGIEVAKESSISSAPPQPCQLDKQKDYLLALNKFNAIETVTLDEGTLLVGLMKHSQPIQRGIFMYPNQIRETDKWDDIKKQAATMQTGIALFRVNQSHVCLRMQTNDPAQTTLYLIDHRAISRIDSLWHPDNLSASTYESSGKPFIK
ncbi:hypothetical protein AQUSIP_13830 [Aquicella siphonis]|uniref:Uncharacterized protein n=1 Tax=Aquicella siphonis TaxID=254247 RepID=A0A5E4PGI2_9COXI|nr:hypothetical protein [Aquicella siphonis]VVC76079.1 hypothetical protein AQUSIP_13830 [Aquicella siphonis]